MAVTGRFCATASAQQQQQQAGSSESETDGEASKGKSTGLMADEPPVGSRKNIVIMSSTTKGVYVHQNYRIGSWYFFATDFMFYFVAALGTFIGSQLFVRYRVAKLATVQQTKLGENLLDQRTRDLLTDVESLRKKDPLRLEDEANKFHELFWNRRANAVADVNKEKRSVEISRGLMQGEARGTDMSEWLGAKQKDDEERELARRTHDYIQGFHQHLKSKRLI
jgi:hypothetical protein